MNTVLERLNVDIRRAHVQCAMNHLVHQPDNRGLAGDILQMLDKVIIALAGERIIENRLGLCLFLQVKLHHLDDVALQTQGE